MQNGSQITSLQIAEEVVTHGWDCVFDAGLFDVETMSNYDAEFSGREPVFLNIWKKDKNMKGAGRLVMDHFLQRVYSETLDRTFITTDFTEPKRDPLTNEIIDKGGQGLINDLVRDGVLEKVGGYTGQQGYPHRFRVVKDPMKDLQDFVDRKHAKMMTRPSCPGRSAGVSTPRRALV